MRDIGLKVISEGQNTVIIGLCHAQKHHARGCKFAKIDGMTTIFTADGKGHMFCSRCWRWHFPFAQYAQPPDVVAIPIASRGSIMGTDGDKGFTPTFHQLLGNLRARRSPPNDQNSPLAKLVWIAVVGGMHLLKPCLLRDDWRHDGCLKSAGCCNNMLCAIEAA